MSGPIGMHEVLGRIAGFRALSASTVSRATLATVPSSGPGTTGPSVRTAFGDVLAGVSSPAPAAPSASGAVAPPVAGRTADVAAARPFAALFAAAGAAHGVDPELLAAVAQVESGYRPDARSSAGAVGLMQFMPATAASLGVDPWDPASAVDGAARLLRSLTDRFGSVDMALAAYNIGPGALAAAGGILPGSQAERYVGAVRRAMGDAT